VDHGGIEFGSPRGSARVAEFDTAATATPASVSDSEIGRAPDIIGEEPVGARWVCTSCHLAQTDAEPLVAKTAPR